MFFVYMLLARFLGPALYGTFGFTLSSIQIISGIFFDLGLFLIVTRDLSIGKDSIFQPGIWLKLGGCLVGSTLLFLLVPIIGIPLLLAASLVIWAIFNSFTDFYFCAFRAKNVMHGEAIIMVSQRFLLLGLLLFIYSGLLPLPPSSRLYASGIAFGCSALFGFLVALALKRIMLPTLTNTVAPGQVMKEIKALAQKVLPLVGVGFFGFIYYKIDIVLLGLLSTREQVGFYTASYRIIEASFMIPIILTNTLYPRLSFAWVNDFEGFSRTLKRSVISLVLISLLAVVCVVFLSRTIVAVLFGSEFLPSAGILGLLVIALIMVYPGYLLTQSLVILGKQRGYLYVAVSAAALNILLNLFFIPLWQAKGAAAATIVTEAVVTGITALVIVRQIALRRNGLKSASMMDIIHES